MATKQAPLVLVTGGAGFIGSQVVDALISDGWRVVVMDNLSSGKRRNVHPGAHFLKMDIGNPKAAKWILQNKPEVILHFAAQINVRRSVKDPIKDAETNIHATLKLMEAASVVKVKKFVFAGSGGALCSNETPIPMKEAQVCDPMSPYAISKRTIEHYGEFYRAQKGLPFVSLRFANVYGPRQNAKGEAGVVAIFITQMLANAPITINGTGTQTRDYLYVSDVVDAVMHTVKRKDVLGVYHIGTGRQTTVNEIYKKLATMIGYKRKPKKGPADQAAPHRSALDAGRFMKQTGWSPRYKLTEGLKTTVLSVQSHLNTKRKICLFPFRTS
ncbi:NAD-dependent epimerase/dehydratase family protein [Candidatus Uhrbacteria bacterium]|nr:NAD-dependent epimerase/dehydratase family protein [Candidatus Uhrbacteria bacterium]MBD3284035.1 NAD-dependent epimerase/dehydratase family protein [Candidatus Uhrbacteria bacterium]